MKKTIILTCSITALSLLNAQELIIFKNENSESQLVNVRSVRKAPTQEMILSMPLDNKQQINFNQEAFKDASREYWYKTTAAELSKGVKIDTTVPGAILRVAPIANSPNELEIKRNALSPNISIYKQGSSSTENGLKTLSQEEASLTSIFKIKEELGSGSFILKAQNLNADPSTEYIVHVREKDSPFVLATQATKDTYLVGESIQVTVELLKEDEKIDLSHYEGYLLSPNGDKIPLSFKDENGTITAYAKINSRDIHQGLWEYEIHVSGNKDGIKVRRSSGVGVGVSFPTARLTGEARAFVAKNAPLEIHIGVEVASPGRYEVKGYLYGLAGSREVPIAVLDSAKWLESGKDVITLRADKRLLRNKKFRKYRIKGVTLIDQSRVAILEKGYSFDFTGYTPPPSNGGGNIPLRQKQ